MHPYRGADVLLPTLHGKEVAIAPALKRTLDINTQVLEIDTDSFGTFSGEVERESDPLTTALKKIEAAHKISSRSLFIASEGSIGNHPTIPLLISDRELLVFKDFSRNLVITESHTSFDIKAQRIEVSERCDLSTFFDKADFPRHGLIVKGRDLSTAPAIKGITDEVELYEAIEKTLKRSPVAIIENDFRAHKSPSRMAAIEIAAEKLAARIAKLCPACQQPGFGVVDVERGVNCAECGLLNPDAIYREIEGCSACRERVPGMILNQELPPAQCIFCNP